MFSYTQRIILFRIGPTVYSQVFRNSLQFFTGSITVDQKVYSAVKKSDVMGIIGEHSKTI